MNYKKDFPIFQNIINHYLDTAATSQKPKIVLDKIMEYYEKYNGNPGRGSHALSMEAAGLLSDAREKVRNFINAEKTEEVICVASRRWRTRRRSGMRGRAFASFPPLPPRDVR